MPTEHDALYCTCPDCRPPGSREEAEGAQRDADDLEAYNSLGGPTDAEIIAEATEKLAKAETLEEGAAIVQEAFKRLYAKEEV